MNRTTSMDSSQQFGFVMECLQLTILSFALPSAQNAACLVPALLQCTSSCTNVSLRIFHESYDAYLIRPNPKDFISSAASRMYRLVHQELKVPFQNGKSPEAPTNDCEEQAGCNKRVTSGHISAEYTLQFVTGSSMRPQ